MENKSMNLTDEQKILRYLKRLMELATVEKPTEEDKEEKKTLTKELSVLMSKAGVKDLVSFISNTESQATDPNTEWEQLVKQHKELELQMKIVKKKEDIESMKAKLKELEKENSYIGGKPDKQGIIPINEEKYQKRLAELNEKIHTAKTSRERIVARLEITNLKIWKATIKAHNGALKTASGASKVANFVQGLSKEMGKLSDYSGFDQKQNDVKTKKKTKGKTKESSKSETNTYDIQDDFGFSQEKVFDKKFKL